jgi:predicted helicase
MQFAKNEKGRDLSTLIYYENIRIMDIPLEAHKFTVNGRSLLEWIVNEYRFVKDSDTGIVNDPNEFSRDPKYIFDLVKKAIFVGIETNSLLMQLPKFTFVK